MQIQAVIDIDKSKIGHTLRRKPIVPPDYLVSNRDAFVISAVSSHTARELIPKLYQPTVSSKLATSSALRKLDAAPAIKLR